jgi:hypothetical protein
MNTNEHEWWDPPSFGPYSGSGWGVVRGLVSFGNQIGTTFALRDYGLVTR